MAWSECGCGGIGVSLGVSESVTMHMAGSVGMTVGLPTRGHTFKALIDSQLRMALHAHIHSPCLDFVWLEFSPAECCHVTMSSCVQLLLYPESKTVL